MLPMVLAPRGVLPSCCSWVSRFPRPVSSRPEWRTAPPAPQLPLAPHASHRHMESSCPLAVSRHGIQLARNGDVENGRVVP